MEPTHKQYRHTRNAVDPVLNLIARRLLDAKWQTELDEGEKNECHSLNTSPTAPRRLIAPALDYKTWLVRIYLGGAQRIVGMVRGPDLTPAYRYADMLKMFFWKYRQRGAHEPGAVELNLSPERAKQDLEHEPEVGAILRDIEAHLLAIGALPTPADRQKALEATREHRWRQRTVAGGLFELRGLMGDRHQELVDQISALRLQVAGLATLIRKE
jgi:hypothetical protein